jgi:hypothetical protein
MATATTTKATTKADGIGVKDLAAKLGTDGRTLRKFLRAQGIGVGFGRTYRWSSMADPAVKRITRAWQQQGQQQAE